jgi:hypothetical protein
MSSLPLRYIANLGHGMLPSHEPRSVAKFVEVTHAYSEEKNKAAAAASIGCCKSESKAGYSVWAGAAAAALAAVGVFAWGLRKTR